MMSFKHFFLQSFKAAADAPPPAPKRFMTAMLRRKILDRIETLKSAKRVSVPRASGITH